LTSVVIESGDGIEKSHLQVRQVEIVGGYGRE
jgi:hypothetical protein